MLLHKNSIYIISSPLKEVMQHNTLHATVLLYSSPYSHVTIFTLHSFIIHSKRTFHTHLRCYVELNGLAPLFFSSVNDGILTRAKRMILFWNQLEEKYLWFSNRIIVTSIGVFFSNFCLIIFTENWFLLFFVCKLSTYV